MPEIILCHFTGSVNKLNEFIRFNGFGRSDIRYVSWVYTHQQIIDTLIFFVIMFEVCLVLMRWIIKMSLTVGDIQQMTILLHLASPLSFFSLLSIYSFIHTMEYLYRFYKLNIIFERKTNHRIYNKRLPSNSS
jgi:hypothetical protein